MLHVMIFSEVETGKSSLNILNPEKPSRTPGFKSLENSVVLGMQIIPAKGCVG